MNTNQPTEMEALLLNLLLVGIVVGLVWLGVRFARGPRRNKDEFDGAAPRPGGRLVCRNCHTISNGALPGSGWIELVLWLCYLIPGLVYSLWRRRRRDICPACRAPNLIPVDTPAGRDLARL